MFHCLKCVVKTFLKLSKYRYNFNIQGSYYSYFLAQPFCIKSKSLQNVEVGTCTPSNRKLSTLCAINLTIQVVSEYTFSHFQPKQSQATNVTDPQIKIQISMDRTKSLCFNPKNGGFSLIMKKVRVVENSNHQKVQ